MIGLRAIKMPTMIDVLDKVGIGGNIILLTQRLENLPDRRDHRIFLKKKTVKIEKDGSDDKVGHNRRYSRAGRQT
jgi:hypothetical protein